MSRPLKPKSIEDYDQKWKKFMGYLEQEIPGCVPIIDDALDFLLKLFNDGLKPATVNHYKSSISKPLLARFGIDLRIPEARDLIWAMYQKRPNKPSQDPHWDLNKVLKYIDEDMPEDLSNEDLLRKTAFLLLLATGIRISELHATLRTRDCCSFTADNFLRLRHHELFLAKNERPDKRWPSRIVKPLYLRDGKRSKLCPVSSLKEYLRRTSSFKSGRLFRSTGKQSKELSKHQLSTEICKLIVKADPGTKAKVHDIRSYASSYSLATTMITPDELADAVGWTSPSTFYQFYRSAIDPLNREVSLPGPDPRIRDR